jgi:hypothetical protein
LIDSHLADEPIFGPVDDLLDRSRYAKQLAQTIHDLPQGSSVRFGIYGDWGEGKTSVMRLVAHDLRERGHRAAFFSPWAAATREEAWNLLLDSIRQETGAKHLRYRVARATSGTAKLLASTTAKLTHFDPIESAGDQLGSLLAKWKRKEQTQILKDASNTLGEGKFVVFVDDLDRTNPALLPTLLMSLRELFDLPNFVYVLGLSPTIVAEGLSSTRQSSVDDGERFLEKIVEYPSYLPDITIDGIRRLVGSGAAISAAAIRASSLEAVEGLLPRNPRRLKLFLRHLVSLRHLLSRFEDTELDWPRFYAIELLRLEFPHVARRLVQDEAVVKAIGSRYYTRLFSPPEVKEGEDLPEEKYAPQEADRRARFLELTDALSTRNFDTGRYTLQEMLTLIDSPPVVTWREFATIAQRVDDAPVGERASIVKEWMRTDADSTEASKARAIFHLAIDLRDQRLDVAVETDPPKERVEAIRAASVGISIISILNEVFRSNTELLTAKEWARLFQHVAKWSRFHHDPLVADVRREELNILSSLTYLFPAEAALGMLEEMPVEDGVSIRDRSSDFLALRSSIRKQLEQQATQALVESFRIPNRLESYIGGSWRFNGKNLLFEPDSPFHSAIGRIPLASLAEEASSNADVHRNFLIYLRLLLSAAVENEGELSAADSRTLIADTPFLTMLWNAALAQPMNPRTLGTLAHHRKKLIASGTPASAMSYPAWVINGDYEFYTAASD